MGQIQLIEAIVIGLLAGLAGWRALAGHHGLLTNLTAGLVGAWIGAFLVGVFGLAWLGLIADVVVPAIVALALVGLLRATAPA